MDIGERKRAEADENRERIVEYFRANPFTRQNECALALGLSQETVSRHVKAIRAELAKAERKKGKRK
jgi:DNA-binding Lrp family transcriptional regulator